jgi:glycosyltransferase involved in cell wall biosynthesis
MHILFVHQNFPAQFGQIGSYLIKKHDCQCTFVSCKPAGVVSGIRRIQYEPKGGATSHNHYCTRSFENAVAHAHGVFEACRQHPEVKPDLIVGHSGFGSTLFLSELYDCPIINYFEYYYHPRNSDLDFRREFPPSSLDRIRSRCRNAMILLDLQNCAAGYSPTQWQRDTLPAIYHEKVRVIFDGVDDTVWRRYPKLPRVIEGRRVDPETRIVTYVSRGFEAMRGFDIFMKLAKRIYTAMPNVLFVVVGADRVAYGGDLRHIKEKSFRDHVLKQDDYDLSKFFFTGLVPPLRLARLLSLSDLHIYLTVPFVLSWSLFNALACGCPVVASQNGPVQEIITHEETGLLADFYDVDSLTALALRVLGDPAGHRRQLGAAGTDLIHRKYTLTRTLPILLDFYQRVGKRQQGLPARGNQAVPQVVPVR